MNNFTQSRALINNNLPDNLIQYITAVRLREVLYQIINEADNNDIEFNQEFTRVTNSILNLRDLVNSKQDYLVWDTTPRHGSTRPVTSGGIFDYIQSVSYGGVEHLKDGPEIGSIQTYRSDKPDFNEAKGTSAIVLGGGSSVRTNGSVSIGGSSNHLYCWGSGTHYTISYQKQNATIPGETEFSNNALMKNLGATASAWIGARLWDYNTGEYLAKIVGTTAGQRSNEIDIITDVTMGELSDFDLGVEANQIYNSTATGFVTALGNFLNVFGQYDFVGGNNNQVNGNYNTVVGSGNTNEGRHNNIFGIGNKHLVSGQLTTTSFTNNIFGSFNYLQNLTTNCHGNSVLGYHNKLNNSSFTNIFGAENTITGVNDNSGKLIVGIHNTVNTPDSFIIGNYNDTNGRTNSVGMIGRYLSADSSTLSTQYLGQYNSPLSPSSESLLLVIGNGNNTSQRHNLLYSTVTNNLIYKTYNTSDKNIFTGDVDIQGDLTINDDGTDVDVLYEINTLKNRVSQLETVLANINQILESVNGEAGH